MPPKKDPRPIAVLEGQHTLYPVKHWNRRLVAIGKHYYRIIESYNWKGQDDPLSLAATRGAVALHKKIPILDFAPSQQGEVDLSDEQSVVVALDDPNMMAETIGVTPHNPFILSSNHGDHCNNCASAPLPLPFDYDSATNTTTPSPTRATTTRGRNRSRSSPPSTSHIHTDGSQPAIDIVADDARRLHPCSPGR